MARRSSVGVTIDGDPTGVERAFAASSKAARAHAAEMKRQQQATQDLAKVVATGATVIAAGFAFSARAAVQWESAFAGVRKTVDGSPAELAAVETQLRAMARSLPASHREISAVAEAAGQLGVKTPDIASFTRTMINMGETTNLSSEEAATGMAQFSNIMGTATSQSSRLGSAIVDLGNDGASTEKDILDMGLRIAGAGKQIGLTEGEVLGMASAMSSLGIESEAGGSAMSRTMITIEQAVRDGGDQLDRFASVSGMTAEQFRTAYEDDAAGAITSFVQGLDRMSESGGDVFGTLEQLELGEIRVRDALLRASAGSDLFTDSIELGNTAFAENNALLAEAAQRYETTEAKMQVAWNTLNDLAISTGQVLVPALADGADRVQDLGQFFASLPGPVQDTITVVGVAGTVIAGTGAAAVIAAPKIAAYDLALQRAGLGALGLGRNLRFMLGVLTGPYGAALLAATTVIGILTDAKIKQRGVIEDVKATLDGETGAITENTRAYMLKDLQERGALDMAEKLGISYQTLLDATLGNADAQAELARRTEEIRGQAAQLHDENGLPMAMTESQEAARYLLGDLNELNKMVGDSADATGVAVEEQDQLNRAMSETTPAAEQAASGEEDLAAAATELTGSTDLAADAMDELRTAIDDVFESTFTLEEANDAFEKGLLDLQAQVERATEAEDENATALDNNSEAALANRSAMRGMVDAGLEVIQRMREQGASTSDVSDRTQELRDQLYNAAVGMGFTKDEAARYADELLNIPAKVSTTVSTPGLNDALYSVEEFARAVANIQRNVRVNIVQATSYVRQEQAQANRPVQGRAVGGRVNYGTPYWVGEKGPELLWPEKDGYVMTAADSKALARSQRLAPMPMPYAQTPAMGAQAAAGGRQPLIGSMHVAAGLSDRDWQRLGTLFAREGERVLAMQVSDR